MSPRRPRRRARRHTLARPLVAVAAVVVVLAVLIGGLTRISRQSAGYDADSDRALAAQGTVLVDQSNATASLVRAVMGDLPGQTRQSLEATLDGAVQQATDESVRAASASASMPQGSPAGEFAAVFAQRAQAVTELRTVLDDFLGMRPLPVAAAPTGSPQQSAGRVTLLSAGQATDRIAAVGAVLAGADARYRMVRRALASAPGHGRLPGSTWVINRAVWRPDAVSAQVDLVATSPTLAASHYVVVRTIRLTPPALPAAPGASTAVSALSPTSTLAVTAVLANQGSAAQPKVATRLALTDQSTGATSSRVITAALGLDAAVTLPTVTFAVTPGTSYELTVRVVLPAGQTRTDGTALRQALRVAPAT